MTSNNYDKIVKKLVIAVKDVAETTMQDACKEIRDTSIDIVDTAVSCDGSWQRRGYSSLNGVVTAISMVNGKVLDIEAMSRACKGCLLKEKLKKTNLTSYEVWKSNHTCKFNYTGTAGNMEPVGAQRIWKRSESKNMLRYTEFYGDGDSKSFNTVRKTYIDTDVKKLECVGHVQKRVGCRLRNLKKREKGLGGRGKLTNHMIDRMQNYYGIAIRANKNDLEAMQAATRATLFHVASNKDNNFHVYCPAGSNSWCKFQKDIADGTTTYKPGPGLPVPVLLKLKPMFEELSHPDLLNKCLHGLTQNQNESFNAMIWDRIPKTRYVSSSLLDVGVYDAVANFNIGRKASILIYEQLNMIPGKYTIKGCHILNKKRLFASGYQNLDSTKKRRKIRRGKGKGEDDKNEEKDGKSYEAGAF
jgi:hypothetical protein